MKEYYCPKCWALVAVIIGKPCREVICPECGYPVGVDELIEQWEGYQ